MNSKIYSIVLSAIAAVFFAACGPEERPEVERPGDGDQAAEATEPEEATVPEAGGGEAAEVVEEDGVQVVEIIVDDTMAFQQDRFEVPAGAEVRLVLRHTGNMPAQAMGHNVVILRQGVEPLEFSMAAARAADRDYVPEDREDDVIAHTEIVGGGEETEMTFTAPEEAGEYTYICSFPGHAAAGMIGVMVVE